MKVDGELLVVRHTMQKGNRETNVIGLDSRQKQKVLKYAVVLFSYITCFIFTFRYSDWKEVCLQDNLLDNLSMNRTLVLFNEKHRGRFVPRISNGFFGAVPKHPFLENALKIILNHVQGSYYGDSVYHTTGPMVFWDSYQIEKAKSNLTNDYSFVGFYRWPNNVYVTTSDGITVIHHTCSNCVTDVKWPTGNSYGELYAARRYYCEDSASLFHADWGSVP